jgi:hypothetical protein
VIGHPKYNSDQFTLVNAGNVAEFKQILRPQPLPIHLQSNVYKEMNAKIVVLAHPYVAITKKDGSYHMPRVPAGAEIGVVGWEENTGWLLGRDGAKQNFKNGKNTYDFELKSPD